MLTNKHSGKTYSYFFGIYFWGISVPEYLFVSIAGIRILWDRLSLGQTTGKGLKVHRYFYCSVFNTITLGSQPAEAPWRRLAIRQINELSMITLIIA